MESEAKALLNGLQLLLDFGLEVYPILIESDSQILVEMVQQQHISSWKLWHLSQEIFSKLSLFNFQITHVYREGNAVADALANLGVRDRELSIYTPSSQIPTTVKLLLQQDGRQMRALRKKISIIRK